MNAGQVHGLIDGKVGTLHCDAWDVSDKLVEEYKAANPNPGAALPASETPK